MQASPEAFWGIRGKVSILPDVRGEFDVLAAIRSVRITGRVRAAARRRRHERSGRTT